jgi:hypothetical protein
MTVINTMTNKQSIKDLSYNKCHKSTFAKEQLRQLSHANALYQSASFPARIPGATRRVRGRDRQHVRGE